MKKLILLTALAISTGICSAQVSFGVQAGANFGMSKLKYDDAYFTSIGATSHDQKNKAKVGFLGGFVVEIPIGSSLAFRPELNFVQEGSKQTLNASNGFATYSEEQKINLNYIQLPLNVIYKVPAGPGTAFFGLGPVLQLGISGKNKYTSSTNPADNENRKVKFDGKKSEGVSDPNYYNDDHLKRFDVGLDVLAGYKLKMGVFIKLAYNPSFLELSPDKKDPDPEDRYSFKNSGFNVSVGYMIGGGRSGKKKKK